MGGKSSQSTSTVQIPPEVLARYNAVNAQAQQAAATPFQPYTGQFVAPLNAVQQAGIAQTGQAANIAQPYYDVAAGMTAGAAQDVGPLTAGQIAQYQNPYTQAVAAPTIQALQQQQGQDRARQQAQAIQSGGFGERSDLARAQLEGQQSLATAQAVSPIFAQSYNTALQTAAGQQGVVAADLARRMQAAQQIAGLGTGAQQAGLSGAQALIGAGTLGQQTTQADLTAQYQQYLQQQGYPFQVSQFLANIAMGTGALSGSTTSTTQPAPFFSDRRLKDDIKKIGKTNDGLPIYSFKYKGSDQTQIGLMAQDVEKKKPDAVGLAAGFKTVDYDKATEGSDRRARAYGGGLMPADNSMGGAVFEPGAFERGGFADGGASDPFMSNLMEAQRKFLFTPGGMGAGMAGGQPGAKGIVPPASLPTPTRLMTATPAQRPAPQITMNDVTGAASLYKTGKEIKQDLFGSKPAQGGGTTPPAAPTTGTATPQPAPVRTSDAGATSGLAPDQGSTPVAGGLAPTPASYETRLGDYDSDWSQDLARGGVAGRKGYAGMGFVNPYNAQDPAGGVGSYIQSASQSEEDPAELKKMQGAPTGGGGGGGQTDFSTLLKFGTTLMDFLPFKDGGVVRQARYSGGLVRPGYVIGGVAPNSLVMGDGSDNTDGGGVVPAVLTPDDSAPDVTLATAPADQGATGVAPPAPAQEKTEERQPRNIRNNNPGNIEASSWAQKQPGYVGSDGRFAVFEKPEHGAAAMDSLLSNYAARGLNTPSGIIGRWAPASDPSNQPGSTSNYVNHVSKQLGVGPDDQIDMSDPVIRQKLAGAMTEFEGGTAKSARASIPAEIRSETSPIKMAAAAGSQLYNAVSDAGTDLGNWFDRNERWLVPLLTGLGTMASSQSRYLGAAMLQGVGGAAQSYANLQKQNSEIAKNSLGLFNQIFEKRTDAAGNVSYYNLQTGQPASPQEAFNYLRKLPGFSSLAAPSTVATPQAPKAPSAPGLAPATTPEAPAGGVAGTQPAAITSAPSPAKPQAGVAGTQAGATTVEAPAGGVAPSAPAAGVVPPAVTPPAPSPATPLKPEEIHDSVALDAWARNQPSVVELQPRIAKQQKIVADMENALNAPQNADTRAAINSQIGPARALLQQSIQLQEDRVKGLKEPYAAAIGEEQKLRPSIVQGQAQAAGTKTAAEQTAMNTPEAIAGRASSAAAMELAKAGALKSTDAGTKWFMDPQNPMPANPGPAPRDPNAPKAAVDPNTGRVMTRPINIGYPMSSGFAPDPAVPAGAAKPEGDAIVKNAAADSMKAEAEMLESARNNDTAKASLIKFADAAKILESKGLNMSKADLSNLMRGLGLEAGADAVMSAKDDAAAYIAAKSTVNQAINTAQQGFNKITQGEFKIVKSEASPDIDKPAETTHSILEGNLASILWQDAFINDWNKAKAQGVRNYQGFLNQWKSEHPASMFQDSANKLLGNLKGQGLPDMKDMTEGVVYVVPSKIPNTPLGSYLTQQGMTPGSLFTLSGVKHGEMGPDGKPKLNFDNLVKVAPQDAFRTHMRAPGLQYGGQ